MRALGVICALLSATNFLDDHRTAACMNTTCTRKEERHILGAATDAQVMIDKVVAFETGQAVTIGKLSHDDLSTLRSRYFGNLTIEDSAYVEGRFLTQLRTLHDILSLDRRLPGYAATPANSGLRVHPARSKAWLRRKERCSIRRKADKDWRRDLCLHSGDRPSEDDIPLPCLQQKSTIRNGVTLAFGSKRHFKH